MTGRPPGPWLIALEGLDGAGTTTQLGHLCDWLRARGRTVWATAEPSRGPIGTLVRQLLKPDQGPVDASALALLFAADRLDHLAREVVPHLEAGADVVTDRYLASSLAYQGLENDLAWVRVINERARWPDLTVFVRVPVEVCLARMAGRSSERDLFEERSFLQRVAAAYESLLPELGSHGRLVVIDGTTEPDEVARAIARAVEEHLGLTS